jgi:hypothetical protein
MTGKIRQTGMIVFAGLAFFACSVSAAPNSSDRALRPLSQNDIDQFLYGDPPRTHSWLRVLAGLPYPPGGPVLYIVKSPAGEPPAGRAFYAQVTPEKYSALRKLSQNFRCHRGTPSRGDVAIVVAEHSGSSTREVCQVRPEETCRYLRAVESFPGVQWSQHAYFDAMREIFHC